MWVTSAYTDLKLADIEELLYGKKRNLSEMLAA
jgi:hypothetical protein